MKPRRGSSAPLLSLCFVTLAGCATSSGEDGSATPPASGNSSLGAPSLPTSPADTAAEGAATATNSTPTGVVAPTTSSSGGVGNAGGGSFPPDAASPTPASTDPSLQGTAGAGGGNLSPSPTAGAGAVPSDLPGAGGAGGSAQGGNGGAQDVIPEDALVIDISMATDVIDVDATSVNQTFEGFGTSLCWFGNVVGGWADPERNEVADLLFDQNLGLGLNVVRYNIGGGDAPDHDHMGAGKEMQGFKPSESAAYDWNADANQRWMLDAAIARIDESEVILEAFSNSPPYWMTASGCASGNGASNNLPNDRVDDFANYLSDVVAHFRGEHGIAFRTLEPLNEPSATWWDPNGAQEGARIDRPLQATLLNALRTSLDDRGLEDVELAAPDESSYEETVDSYNSYDTNTRALVQQINTHAYSGSARTQIRDLAARDGKRVWSSEIDGSGAPAPFDEFTHNHDDIAPGLDLANRVIRDLREMHSHAWVFWQAVENEQAQINLNKNWGLLHGNFEGAAQGVSPTKKYYVMMQFSRAIRPGYVMLDIDQPDAVAFYDPEGGSLAIVQRNTAQAEAVWAYDLSGFGTLPGVAKVWRTSATENHEALADVGIVNGMLVTPIAAQSVSSFVITGVGGAP